MSKARGLTKFLLVWICVGCAIVAVLNIPDRFTYEGLQTASEMVSVKADLVESELSYLHVVSSCTDIYDPSSFQSFHLEPAWDPVYGDQPLGILDSYYNHYNIVMFDGLAGLPTTNVTIVAENVYLDIADVPKVESMLFFLSHSLATNVNLFFAVNMISFYASALFNIFFDTLPVVFSVLRAALYLIGIG